MARRSQKAPAKIDPAAAVNNDDLLRDIGRLKKKFFTRYPEPPAMTSTAKNSGRPVQGTGKKWIQYSKGGINAWKRVNRKLNDLYQDVAAMQNAAQYVKKPDEEQNGKVVPLTSGRRKGRKKSA